MVMSIEISVRGSVFERGKDYVARIVGTHPKYGLEREFLAAAREASRSGRTWTRRAIVTEPGLYEASSTGRRGPKREYYLIEDHGGHLTVRGVSESYAYEVAGRMKKV
jgi:hypothetical protein